MMAHRDTFTELLHRHSAMVEHLCYVCAGGNREQCRDLMQEVFIALWLNREKLSPDSTPEEERAWVRWVTRSTLDHLQRNERPMLLPLPDNLADILPDTDTSAQTETVDELLSSLNPDERRILRLKLDGFPSDEIATIMGTNRNTIYQRVFRAVAKARRVALLVVSLLTVTAVAVAVVPGWRQTILGEPETPQRDTPLPPSKKEIIRQVDTAAATDSFPPPVIDVVWNYEGWNRDGWSVTYCRNDSSISLTRYTGSGWVTATARNLPSIIWNDTLIPDSMNTVLKRAAQTAVMVALATATQAQTHYDFQSVTPQGDTLLCSITEPSLLHVSIRGGEYLWNAPSITYSDTLIIPQTVEHDGVQYTVTALGDSAFYSHREVKAISIPATVTTIGRSALAGTSIVELVVPDNVDTIGTNAFALIGNVVYHGTASGSPWGALTLNAYEEDGIFYSDTTRTRVTSCRPGATQVVLTSTVRVIGRYAFYNSASLTSITLPDGLDTIGRSAFDRCSQLGSIVIPHSLKAIGNYAFSSAFREDGSSTLTIADAPCSIGIGVFAYSNVGAVDLGDSIVSIGRDAFCQCNNLDSIIVPNSCTYLAPRAFCYNYFNRLKKVHLPDGLDSIRDELLHGCTELVEVNIPSTVVYIGEMALAELFNVNDLTLPAGLTYLGPWALGSSYRISDMTCLAPVPPQACPNSFEGMNANISLNVPCGSGTAYQADPQWSYFQNIEEDCDAVLQADSMSVTLHCEHGCIVVEGAEGKTVQVFDIEGRLMATTKCHGTCTLRMPTGIYLVQVGDCPAQKIVVIE